MARLDVQSEWQAIRRYLDACLPDYRSAVLSRLKRFEGAPLTEVSVEAMWSCIADAERAYQGNRSKEELTAARVRASAERPPFEPPVVKGVDLGLGRDRTAVAVVQPQEAYNAWLKSEEARKAALREAAVAEAQRVADEHARREAARRASPEFKLKEKQRQRREQAKAGRSVKRAIEDLL